MRYSRVSKLATSPISKRFTYKNHPTLNQNACFSSLVDLKSPSTSSKNGYTNYPKNLLLVKQYYHNSGVDKQYKNILGTPERTSKYYLISSGRVGLESLKRISLLLFSVLTCIVTLEVFGCWQKIPYTNRIHIVFAPSFWEKLVGDIFFERVQLSTLSEEHPDSLRVKMIGEKIVEALESDLKAMKNQNVNVGVGVYHLVGYKWKFIVADDPSVTAVSIPGGKIFVCTGLLKKLESDAEIATVIGHQVGHQVARHFAERNNMRMLVSNIRVFFGLAESNLKIGVHTHSPSWIIKWIRVLFQYPKCRRRENEADDIGLLVMASAGYDPQVAPKVYEIIENNASPESVYFNVHSPGNKRAKELARGEVMKEASSMYSKVIETRKMNGLKDH